MDTKALEEIGFTNGEINTYLALLELGEVKVGAIIERSMMASSAVHNSLNTLLEKGAISYIKKGKIKFYKPIKPKQLLDLIDLKKEKLISIIPELELKQNLSQNKQEAEIFEGSNGVVSMLNILIEDMKKGDKYLYFSLNTRDLNEEIQEFFSRYDMKRKERGIVVLGLAPKEVKKFMKSRKHIQMRFTKLPIPEGIAICKNRIGIFSWGKTPVGYLIKSKQVSEMYTNLFFKIWDKN